MTEHEKVALAELFCNIHSHKRKVTGISNKDFRAFFALVPDHTPIGVSVFKTRGGWGNESKMDSIALFGAVTIIHPTNQRMKILNFHFHYYNCAGYVLSFVPVRDIEINLTAIPLSSIHGKDSELSFFFFVCRNASEKYVEVGSV